MKLITQLKKITGIATLTLGLVVFGHSANATIVYDFAALASGNEGAFTSTTIGGITLSGSAESQDGNSTYTAYLDDVSGGLEAGLGVCKVLDNEGDCDPSSDDNLLGIELLALTFSEEVWIADIYFRNADHGTTFDRGADFEVSIDGGAFVSYTLENMFSAGFTGTTFEFIADDIVSNDGDQLYINKLIVNTPEPGTLIMMIIGLGLLGLSRRKSG